MVVCASRETLADLDQRVVAVAVVVETPVPVAGHRASYDTIGNTLPQRPRQMPPVGVESTAAREKAARPTQEEVLTAGHGLRG